ncbi:FAD-binding and (Fe-S)-binding domain-containing protein [Sansalvadorimonas verongulae]|uniref:FAD-binding and (Fe-S)-binding domain-containing protein n=1 Tax=Sansalvadorimonas verongulae TaxID=2172824 RepID=UPI0012BB4D6A|nr:FAD-binding and (Fe-S)-binding domain-containing protein [Sansalvadorimonas verongulae]MTI13425.1 FAD-binding oxidoreductase [Sansalvadorimonas verongulae]
MSSAITTLCNQLKTTIPAERLLTDFSRRMAFGTDASFYRLIPQLVVLVETEDEVQLVIREAAEQHIPLTFRAAGTSLSGQAISDSVLVVASNGWTDHEIIDNGARIRLQAGVIGADANAFLAPFGRKIGPDPGSINTCRIGGIAANNASGMCCGVAQNTYHTLDSIRLIMADGTLVDTADSVSVAAFRESHKELLRDLKKLADDVAENKELSDKIRHKYRLKNTTGLSINALVDFTDPLDILTHLMIGSEGILGFISSVTYNTVPEYANKASSLIVFPDVATCCRAVTALKPAPVDSVELLDRRAMGSVIGKPGLPDFINESLSETACSLLIETRGKDHETLLTQIDEIEKVVAEFTVTDRVAFTEVEAEYSALWAVRKGMLPAVGAVRDTGTSVIIEDIAFPVEQLTEGVLRLQELFEKYEYSEALIFGHALEGNLHFVFPQNFDSNEEVERYRKFMDDVAQLVAVDFGGSLKAEHGTGRNMAPFVELEWGTDAYRLMKGVKELFDPANLLNPGVIINEDKQSHIANLKPMPAADEIIDKCMECGFCEPACPSQHLTLTPRKRIALWREICRLRREAKDSADKKRLQDMEDVFGYAGLETCAACGLCSLRCPVGINTGTLTKKLREKNNAAYKGIASRVGNHFSGTTTAVRASLKVADMAHGVLGTDAMAKVTGGLRSLSGNRIPLWNEAMPKAASQKPLEHKPKAATPGQKTVVYFPSCSTRNMAPGRDDFEQEPLTAVVIRLFEAAGYRVVLPENTSALCCGQPFSSKGQPEVAAQKKEELRLALMKATNNGEFPVISDASSCSWQQRENGMGSLQVFDLVEFIHDVLLDKWTLTPVEDPVMVHVPCSLQKLGSGEKLKNIVRKCTTEMIVPHGITCCGFAGDKGFSTPELNKSALKPLKAQVPATAKEGISANRTCEIGLSSNSGVPYHSVVYLLDRCIQK